MFSKKIRVNKNLLINKSRDFSIEVQRQTHSFFMTKTKKLANSFVKVLNRAYLSADNDIGVESHYKGVSFRFMSLDIDSIMGIIKNEGLKNNCRPGEIADNFCIQKYVELNARSPWFGGCAKIEEAANIGHAMSQYFDMEHKYVLFIEPTLPNDVRKKEYVNVLYFQRMGEINPKGHEMEIIHSNGDFADLVPHIIRFDDVPLALNGEKVFCHLTEKKFNPLDWIKKYEKETPEHSHEKSIFDNGF
ncbi:MAG: hypothetical protein HYX60_01785 [Legionella longbeachae]|nr:hypothetical protein [Legionella longbeachae]